MSETGLLCTFFTLTFLNIALKMIKHLFDEVEKEGNETGRRDFFTPKGFLFKAAVKATLSVPGPLSTSAPFPAVHHMARASGFILRPFLHIQYFHLYSSYPAQETAPVSRVRSSNLVTKKLIVHSHG